MIRFTTLALLLSPLAAVAQAPETLPAPRPTIDPAEYKSPATAVRADPKTFRLDRPAGQTGFLGVEVGADPSGRPTVLDVAPGSPAEVAGLKAGDQLVAVGGSDVSSVAVAKDRLRGLTAGDPVKLTVRGKTGSSREVSVTPRAASKPMQATSARSVLPGLRAIASGGGAEVRDVATGGQAEKVGVKVGDVIVRVDDAKLDAETGLREAVASKKPGDVVTLSVVREKKDLQFRLTVEAEPATGFGGKGGAGGWDDRLPRAWTKPAYNLAVIGIEYPDVKHNPKIKDADWDASLFSRDRYTGESATGQKVHGSMADYFHAISYGKFGVKGKFVGWVPVKKKRAEYSSGSGTSVREKTALLAEALDKYLETNGKDALKEYDGVFFIYAGGRVQTTRGGLYWPHRATLTHQGKRWPYFIVQEGGERMTDISVFCHEFGHMLGLPDLYARPEVPGMEGVGVWCAMSQQNGGGKPQQFSAWCKEQLGWITATPIDPRVKQKLVLKPVTAGPAEYFKVLVKPDGSEYFLLENRAKEGADSSLPASGLLVWRVIKGGVQPVYLEEAHGVEGPSGPRVFTGAVPFPSPANTSFTPYTTPSSKSQSGGGLDVYLTDIRRWPDGRVTFRIGYEYQ
ncbi:MAG: M6 family metalloprotease domain-containing protein [Gemmataceae bacterium]